MNGANSESSDRKGVTTQATWEEQSPAGASPFGTAALEYSQKLGWAVFPCARREKVPIIPKLSGGRGCLDATTAPDVVRDWWQRWPAANVAIATGGRHGLIVIDVDGLEGEDALSRLGELPPTPQVRTVKGRHLYFTTTREFARCTTRRLGPKIDTRGSGGYVLAPPSVHPEGVVYEWILGLTPDDVAIAELPASLAHILAEPAALRSAQKDLSAAPTRPTTGAKRNEIKALEAWLRRVPTGLALGDGRNATAYRIAARALECLSAVDTAALLDAWNRGNREPLNARDLARILRNASRYARGRVA